MEEELLKHITIKSLSEDDRPREKLVNLGRQHLSDAELLAIILNSGSRTETALQLAQRILSAYGNDINLIARQPVNELKKFKGVGLVKALNISAAFELGRRRNDAEQPLRPKICSSEDSYNFILKKLSNLPHEEFWIMFLNRANRLIKAECISKGGVSGTVVDVRLILKPAIENLASGIIVCHNHPSGQVRPSPEDVILTKKIKDSAKLMDISLLDHLVIGDSGYFSFSDEGLL